MSIIVLCANKKCKEKGELLCCESGATYYCKNHISEPFRVKCSYCEATVCRICTTSWCYRCLDYWCRSSIWCLIIGWNHTLNCGPLQCEKYGHVKLRNAYTKELIPDIALTYEPQKGSDKEKD